MSLISKKDIIAAAGLQKLGFLKSPVASALMSATKLNQLNKLYDKLKDKEGAEFFESYFKELNVNYLVFAEDLAKIPKTGPFVLVANHPLGALDGVLMTKIISEIRPDFKIMGNFLLSKIKPMQPYVISVNPFEGRKEAFNSMGGMREALKILQEGGCFGVFPAGEVSNKNNKYNEVMDKDWEVPILKLIQKSNVPVVPMYFHAHNSRTFYNLAKVHPDLQTLLLPSEMLCKREKPIRIRIGRPILPRIMKEYETPKELGDFLKNKVYMMKSYFEKRSKISDYLKIPNLSSAFQLKQDDNTVQNIISETPKEDIVNELNQLRNIPGKLLFSNGDYDIFFTTSDEIPFVMREIGRQRELTFRDVGEGTNMPFDLDEYDKHYHHLFLWDNSVQRLVGAYRMALGVEVMKKYGIQGFYTNSLFDFDQELQPFFRKVIEMGRAYISKDYQQKPLPLFLLWKGIVHVCLRNPEHKFLMGGVSISNKFSDFSKTLMIEFMRSHYYDSVVAQYIHPKNEYKVRLKEREKLLFFEGLDNDLNKFDKLIDDFEPGMRLPVLIKKYIKQNAKVVAFNVDPNFNDAIDGLMYIRISDIPESTIKPVLEEMSEFYKAFNENNQLDTQ
ncbi:lysophospholipid acyltransferase family protein [Elizabethkingia sp. JS20170427COW]|uniref:lysophospholipid acyltransferase family protein n=1 Tax=Elizabethkingia sp. JS20170427COW TaxID=2583851 RepID=UPI0011106EAF|nr:lysophospholipid acyltransferase family protein [Elizabethkingia sp. JS20170427COW]QCX53547.1 lysophospholipid acyltransferase family protein [Elizabethkingia sp. JS20170427COW]